MPTIRTPNKPSSRPVGENATGNTTTNSNTSGRNVKTNFSGAPKDDVLQSPTAPSIRPAPFTNSQQISTVASKNIFHAINSINTSYALRGAQRTFEAASSLLSALPQCWIEPNPETFQLVDAIASDASNSNDGNSNSNGGVSSFCYATYSLPESFLFEIRHRKQMIENAKMRNHDPQEQQQHHHHQDNTNISDPLHLKVSTNWNQEFQLALDRCFIGVATSSSSSSSSPSPCSSPRDLRRSKIQSQRREAGKLIDQLLSQFDRECEAVIVPAFVNLMFDPAALKVTADETATSRNNNNNNGNAVFASNNNNGNQFIDNNNDEDDDICGNQSPTACGVDGEMRDGQGRFLRDPLMVRMQKLQQLEREKQMAKEKHDQQEREGTNYTSANDSTSPTKDEYSQQQQQQQNTTISVGGGSFLNVPNNNQLGNKTHSFASLGSFATFNLSQQVREVSITLNNNNNNNNVNNVSTSNRDGTEVKGPRTSNNNNNNNKDDETINGQHNNNNDNNNNSNSTTTVLVPPATEFEIHVSLIKTNKIDGAEQGDAVEFIKKEIECQRFFLSLLLQCCFIRPLPVTVAPMFLGSYKGHYVLVTTVPKLVGGTTKLTPQNCPDLAASLDQVCRACGFSNNFTRNDNSSSACANISCSIGCDGRLYVNSMLGLLPFLPGPSSNNNKNNKNSKIKSPPLLLLSKGIMLSGRQTLDYIQFCAEHEMQDTPIWDPCDVAGFFLKPEHGKARQMIQRFVAEKILSNDEENSIMTNAKSNPSWFLGLQLLSTVIAASAVPSAASLPSSSPSLKNDERRKLQGQVLPVVVEILARTLAHYFHTVFVSRQIAEKIVLSGTGSLTKLYIPRARIRNFPNMMMMMTTTNTHNNNNNNNFGEFVSSYHPNQTPSGNFVMAGFDSSNNNHNSSNRRDSNVNGAGSYSSNTTAASTDFIGVLAAMFCTKEGQQKLWNSADAREFPELCENLFPGSLRAFSMLLSSSSSDTKNSKDMKTPFDLIFEANRDYGDGPANEASQTQAYNPRQPEMKIDNPTHSSTSADNSCKTNTTLIPRLVFNSQNSDHHNNHNNNNSNQRDALLVVTPPKLHSDNQSSSSVLKEQLLSRFAELIGVTFAPGVSTAGTLEYHFVTNSTQGFEEVKFWGSTNRSSENNNNNNNKATSPFFETLDDEFGLGKLVGDFAFQWRFQKFICEDVLDEDNNNNNQNKNKSEKNNGTNVSPSPKFTLEDLHREIEEAQMTLLDSATSSKTRQSTTGTFQVFDAIHLTEHLVAKYCLNESSADADISLKCLESCVSILNRILSSSASAPSSSSNNNKQSNTSAPSYLMIFCRYKLALFLEKLSRFDEAVTELTRATFEMSEFNNIQQQTRNRHHHHHSRRNGGQKNIECDEDVASVEGEDENNANQNISSALVLPILLALQRIHEALNLMDLAAADARAIFAIQSTLHHQTTLFECKPFLAKLLFSANLFSKNSNNSNHQGQNSSNSTAAMMPFTPHLAVGVAGGNLGMVLTATGRKQEAENLLQQELQSWENVEREEDTSCSFLATGVNRNSGFVVDQQQQQQQQFSSVNHLMVQGITIEESSLCGGGGGGGGGSVFSSARNNNPLGAALGGQHLKNDSFAHHFHQQAATPSASPLTQTLKNLHHLAFPPPTHSPAVGNLALVLNNLACLKVALKKYDEAVLLYQREIRMLEKDLHHHECYSSGVIDGGDEETTTSGKNKKAQLQQELHLVRLNLATAFMHLTQWSKAELLFALAQEAMGEQHGVRSLEVGEVLLKKVMLHLSRVKSLSAAIKFNEEQIETRKKSQKLLVIKDNKDLLGDGDVKNAASMLNDGDANNNNSDDQEEEYLNVNQDKELRSQLLSFAQEILEDAFDIFSEVNVKSKGSATIEISGIGVKQLMKRCCLLGVSAAKEDAMNQDLVSRWERRK